QVGATPGHQIAVHRAVTGKVKEHGGTAYAFLSRFDVDGAVLFFTIDGPDRARCLEAAEQAAAEAGGHLLGRPAEAWAAYYRELKRELDPENIMNPDALLCAAAV